MKSSPFLLPAPAFSLPFHSITDLFPCVTSRPSFSLYTPHEILDSFQQIFFYLIRVHKTWLELHIPCSQISLTEKPFFLCDEQDWTSGSVGSYTRNVGSCLSEGIKPLPGLTSSFLTPGMLLPSYQLLTPFSFLIHSRSYPG